MKLFLVLGVLGVLALSGVNGQSGACPSTGGTPYDYSQALCMSFLFYEAQRSGDLPDDQRVTWRVDSTVNDGSDVGLDLAGGYFDAGDYVKFGFPMAFTSTSLAWGLISYPNGYATAGQTDYAKASIRWATDYFLKCYSSYRIFYGQVGDGYADHGYWGRPEEMTMARPSMALDDEAGGSDLLGETSAALSSAYIIFKNDDPAYADQLLAVSRDLFTWADERRVVYTSSIPGANDFYASWSGYGDELGWSALWLYYATGEQFYLDKFTGFMGEFGLTGQPSQFSWDDKKAGIWALHREAVGSTTYEGDLRTFLDYIVYTAPKSPQGMLFLDPWGSLRHAMNVAFLLMKGDDYGMNGDYKPMAEQQLNYALGSAARSYVVGFGNNPPGSAHHRSSSCPNQPEVCDWDDFNSAAPNPQILYGALVGGPDGNDYYVDARDDYQSNEVACDYNALFTGVLAAKISKG